MRQHGTRIVKVQKSELITKIKENKKNHIEMYEKAVVAYRKVALKQLEEQTQRVKEGELDATLRLVTPENREKDYDKLLLMFEMEVEDVVELEQSEFNQYVHDEFDFAVRAMMSNRTYL